MGDGLNLRVTEHKIGFGGAGNSVSLVVVLVILLGISIAAAMYEGNEFVALLGIAAAILFGAMLFFLPSVVAHNVSDRIPEIKALKASDERFEKVVIRHEYFWVIFILNLIFGATGLVWLALFFWAHMPGTVTIPQGVMRSLASGVEPDHTREDTPEDVSPIAEKPDQPSSTVTPLEERLLEVADLLERGVISVDEAADRRHRLLKKV